ncbi:ATP-binding protein [Hamadaea tsunoensis]|uniref:ATP-binding protein n=1 Tax=Hamadaea tsunoensis TaxID=53368 RepID=UPI0003F67508|nr:ATP-binding protein [Hamadaea tsunoensis]
MTVTVASATRTGGVVRLVLTGTLTTESVTVIRQILHRHLAEDVTAVVVDAAGLTSQSSIHLTVFPTVAGHQGPPAPALLLAAPSAALRAMMGGGVLGDIPVFDTFEAAYAAAVDAPDPSRRRLRLPPAVTAPAAARRFVLAACADWQVDDAAEAAELIVSELVANAVEHARTEMTLIVALRGSHLYLAVQDGSGVLPVPTAVDHLAADPPAIRGRGLHLVNIHATAWGSLPTSDGKRIWAAIRVRDRSFG